MAALIDLFAGCGGLTRGFLDAMPDLEILRSVEIDRPAASTYAVNFGEDHVFIGDIADFTKIPRADLVVGGPPCQGFSALGARNADDPRNRLWREYVRVVAKASPKIFVLENVDRFFTSDEFALLRAELSDGALKRWRHVSFGVLNAADFGTPQRRRRAILIASRVGPVSLPESTHADGDDARRPWLTTYDAFGDVEWHPERTDLPDQNVDVLGAPIPGRFKMADLHIGRNPTRESVARYDYIPPGGNRFDLPPELLPPCWAKKPTGTTDVMGRMRWDRPSLTIRTEFFKPEKGRYLHPQWVKRPKRDRVNRPITHLEAARLQGFPDHFEWCGTKQQIARQIGNAVPPPLARAIATAIADRL